MKLWCRVRRAPVCLVTASLLGIIIGLTGSRALGLPNLFGGPTLVIPLALIFPLVVPIVFAWALTEGDEWIEAVSSRPIVQFDAAFALMVASLSLIICILVQHVGESSLGNAAGRNVLGYLGLTLLGRRILGGQAALVPALGFIVIVSLLGSGPDRRPHWWAWPLASANAPLSWMLALGTLVFGLGLILWCNQPLILNR